MSDDRKVRRRSDDECRAWAKRLKIYYGIDRVWPVNVIRLLKSGRILTPAGERLLVFHVVPDDAMSGNDGSCQMIGNVIHVTVPKSVEEQALFGVGRARMTLAHELMHASLHAEEGVVDHREAQASGTTTLSKISAGESAEHQAKVGAAAFLIDLEYAETLSAEQISEEFGVSFEAAKICREQLDALKTHREAAKRVAEKANEFRKMVEEQDRPSKQPPYLDVPCVACRQATLIPIAAKVMCTSPFCGYVGDHPQSGDPS